MLDEQVITENEQTTEIDVVKPKRKYQKRGRPILTPMELNRQKLAKQDWWTKDKIAKSYARYHSISKVAKDSNRSIQVITKYLQQPKMIQKIKY